MADDFAIDTPAKRRRLEARRNPYWHGVGGGRAGLSLGYRKAARGAGAWVAKAVAGGQRAEERIGVADDAEAPAGALTYAQAVAAALAWADRRRATMRAEAQGLTAPTVRRAVLEYVPLRKKRSARDGRHAETRFEKHVLPDTKFAELPLARLEASHIEAWRDRLPRRERGETAEERPGTLAPAGVDRLLSDLRAALNRAGERYRRILPGHFLLEVKLGTRPSRERSTPQMLLLSDDQVRRAIDAAFAQDEDFGRLALLAAATGARFSQLARLRVADLQVDRQRVLIPSSAKGRGLNVKPPAAVPLTPDVVEKLRPAVEGRAPDMVLLERWHMVCVADRTWERSHRREWRPSDVNRPWHKLRIAAELPANAVPYSLRHSAIVRALRSGLPIRLVAATFDTSTAMIEKTYSAWVTEASEDLARRGALSLAAPPAD